MLTSLLVALALTAPLQQDPTLTEMPEGWVNGKKSGWDGDYPPGWEKKTEEEKQKFLEKWNNAKFKYIKAMTGTKGNPTGNVTGIILMLKAVNAGLDIDPTQQLALFGQQQKLKENEYTIMMKATAQAASGTDVPHGEAVNITKDIVVSFGLRGSALDQRIRAEIAKKHKQIQAEKAKKEKEKEKENEGKDKKE